MISIKVAVEQMAWANNRFFAFLETIPDEAWWAKIADGEWDIAHYAFHLVASSDWYCYMLGQPLRYTSEPRSLAEVKALRPVINEFDAFLIAQASLDDETLTYIDDNEPRSMRRSMVLTQALIHAVEHRTQAVAALKLCGFYSPDLDSFSMWPYAD